MSRPFIPAPRCIACELIYSYEGQVCENTIHVKALTTPTHDTLAQARDVIYYWWDFAYAAQMALQVQFYRIRLKGLDTPDSPLLDEQVVPIKNGQNTNGAPLPGNVSWCVKWQTAYAGRSQRGRWYVCGLTYGNTTGFGTVTSTWGNAVVAALNQLLVLFTDVSLFPTVVSYRSNKAWRTTASTKTITSAVAVDYNLDSMRRRLPGRGHV